MTWSWSATTINLDVIGNGNLKTGARATIGQGDGPANVNVDVGGNVKLWQFHKHRRRVPVRWLASRKAPGPNAPVRRSV